MLGNMVLSSSGKLYWLVMFVGCLDIWGFEKMG